MRKEFHLPTTANSNPWTWALLAIAVAILVVVSCILATLGFYYLRSISKNPIPEPQTSLTQEVTITSTPYPGEATATVDLTNMPGELTPSPTAEGTVSPSPQPTSTILLTLDATLDPLFGSVPLQHNFSPDPFTTYAQAGGMVDTAVVGLGCYFTTSEPTFSFSFDGGEADTFLRIFFVADDESDTAMVLLTPNQEWFCVNDSAYGNTLNPVIDLGFAASGTYTIWLGMELDGSFIAGTLYVTQSIDVSP
jgi:hypothetical protein